MGENKWRQADDWPLPETQWTKLYLRNWERLTPEPFMPASVDQFTPPDAFVQMPPSQTNVIQKLRYLSEPLPQDVLIAGPAVLNLFAAIDQDDTNWIVVIKDVGPDVSVMSVREGERELPKNLPEREITRGWLKASHRALDPKRSKPWKPWHPLTRAAQQAGGAGRDQRIRHRDHGDRQPVPARATGSASRSPAWTYPPASPERPTRSMCRITSAAARPCCTRSITTPIGHRICCCRSSRTFNRNIRGSSCGSSISRSH